MHTKLRTAALVAACLAGALSSGTASAASCSSTFNLGTLGPPAITFIQNGFSSVQSFNDCYNFSLNNSADAFGLTLEWDFSLLNNIDIGSVSLSGTGLASPVVDTTPAQFSFSNLLQGAYQLIVSGSVTGFDYSSRGGDTVGYLGALATSRASMAAPVPEPETYAMLGLGLGIVGWAAKRRRQASR